jgi:hypothetical protein
MTWYVSRRLPAPVDATADALDRLTGAGVVPFALPSDGIAGPGLGPARVPIARSPLNGPVRRLRGTLRLRGLGGTVPVEVELQAWSRRVSEVGIRPVTRRPPTWRAESYFASVAQLLDELSDRLLLTLAAEESASQLARAS